MSFLDNLENSLKALESQEARDPAQRKRDLEAREAARAAAMGVAPHAEALKNGAFTQQVLSAARTTGHRMRTFVDIAWIGTTLRLEARGRRLELRPTAEGVVAVYEEGGQEVRVAPVDLGGDGGALVESWLKAE